MKIALVALALVASGCLVGTVVVDVETLPGGGVRVKSCELNQGAGAMVSLEKCIWREAKPAPTAP